MDNYNLAMEASKIIIALKYEKNEKSPEKVGFITNDVLKTKWKTLKTEISKLVQ